MSDLPSQAEMEEITSGAAPEAPGVVLCEAALAAVPAEASRVLAGRLLASGIRSLDVGPLEAGGAALLQGLERRPGLVLRAGCGTPEALRRALAARAEGWGAQELALAVPPEAGEAFWSALAEAVAGHAPLIGILGGAFDGPAARERVVEAAERLAEAGVARIAIEDAAGCATPPRVRDLIGWLHGAVPMATLVARFGDARGTGLANTLAAVEAGIAHADCALGGLGGATCTEDLAAALEAMGYATGLDMAALRAAGLEAERLLERSLGARILRTPDRQA